MAKKTLLSIVQGLLSDIDGDEVNAISDTTESLQVAQVVQSVYEDLMTRKYQPHLKSLFALDSTTSTTPTHMRMPENVMEVNIINYDKKNSIQTDPKVQEVFYKEPIDFLIYINGRNSDNSDVDLVTDFGGTNIKIINDTAPTYWTSFDDEYIVFDSYDSDVDSNLQNSKSQLVGYKEPSLSIDDATIPDMPAEGFPLLISEAKKQCLADIKQVDATDTSYRESVKRSKKQNTHNQRKKWRAHKQSKYPDYGRS